MRTRVILILSMVGAIMLLLVLAACQGATGPAGPSGPPGSSAPAVSPDQTKIKASHGDLTLGQIAEIQPGLGTVMIEYGTRFDNMWFAAQASNWDMVKYQITEMTEIQEVAENTRPNRAPMLKAFEDGFLTPLGKSADAKDLAAFTKAYDNAIGSCNGCHAASSSRDFPSYKFVKITRPTAPDFQNVDWSGGK